MAIDRNQAKPPVLPKETVESAPIGGEIIIRGLMWSDRQAMYGAAQARADPSRTGARSTPSVMSRAVGDDDSRHPHTLPACRF